MEKKSFKEVLTEPQNIIAIGVTVISICALIVSIMQTRIMAEQRVLMHEQAKVSVWPRLEIGRYKSHSLKDNTIDDYYLNITNGGVGPAIVTDMRVSYNGIIAKKWGHLFQNFNLPDSIPTYRGSSDVNNSIIKIGDEVMFLNLSQNLSLAKYYYKYEENIKMEVWYKSIYGDKWKVTYEKTNCVTEEIESDFVLSDEEQFEN
ncbi:MAG: hypothetical protein AB8H03_15310 [Saprospiraceae bacterium]